MEKHRDHKHFWKLWSVQLNAIGLALGAMATAYGATLAIAPKLVEGIPTWVGVVLTVLTMVTNGLAMYVRTITQAKLAEKT